MKAQRPRKRLGQGRSRPRRWCAAPASTRAQPWTTPNNYSLSGLSGATTFAPAYDAGALNPGCMPLFVALIAAIVLREKPSKAQKFGLSLILSGALIII